jgi:hypothetical protein
MDDQPKNGLATANSHIQTQPSIYSSDQAFERAQRFAKQLASSDMVPTQYKNNLSNTMIAMEMANRTGSSPIMVMQNLHIIQGKPSWSSSFIIAALNSCGRFSPIRFKITELGEKSVEYTEWSGSKQQGNLQRVKKQLKFVDKQCVAYAYDSHGNLMEGPPASIEMAVREGWYTKSDSKWPTMTDLMLSYRSAAFFGRLYAPDMLMGMQTSEEITDFTTGQTTSPPIVEIINQRASAPEPNPVQPHWNVPEDAHIMNEEIK